MGLLPLLGSAPSPNAGRFWRNSLRRLPWGFQVLVFVVSRCVRSPSHLPGDFLECEWVLVVHRRVRETSLSQRITFRQSGNTSGGRPQTALSGGGDPTERHLPTRQECR